MRPSMWTNLARHATRYGASRIAEVRGCFHRAEQLNPSRCYSSSDVEKFPLMFMLEDHRYPVGYLLADSLPDLKAAGVREMFFESSSEQTTEMLYSKMNDDHDKLFDLLAQNHPKILNALYSLAKNMNPGSRYRADKEDCMKVIDLVGYKGIKDAVFALYGGGKGDADRDHNLVDLAYNIHNLANMSVEKMVNKSLEVFGADHCHNVDTSDSLLIQESLLDPSAMGARNVSILRNILKISADSGIYIGGIGHYTEGNFGFANLLDVNHQDGGIGDFPHIKPKDVIFMYPRMSEEQSRSTFRAGPPLFPLYSFYAGDMKPKEFSEKCQEVTREHKEYVTALERAKNRVR